MTTVASSSPSSGGSPAGGARPVVLSVGFKDKATLLAAYIPLFAEGGVFVSTKDEYELGHEIYLLLSLPDDAQRYPVAGRIAWITPLGAGNGRLPGVGVRFSADDKGVQLKACIEKLLGAALGSDGPSLTL